MNPNDFGKKYLVEQCRKIRMADFARNVKLKLKETMLASAIEAEEQSILIKKSKTGFGGTRFWFSCPICNKRAGVLYKHPISEILGCRRCLRLDYRKHRYSKMIENSV